MVYSYERYEVPVVNTMQETRGRRGNRRPVTVLQEFDMVVFYPNLDRDRFDCRPAIILQQPVQAFFQIENTSNWDIMARTFASFGYIAYYSKEFSFQFEGEDPGPLVFGQARRGRAMWEKLRDVENNDPNSPLYQFVCPSTCGIGYSLGGGTVQAFASESANDPSVKCIVPMHASVAGDATQNINVPVLLGTGNGDSVTDRFTSPIFDQLTKAPKLLDRFETFDRASNTQ